MMRGFGSKPWHFVLDGSPCTWLDIEQTAHGTMWTGQQLSRSKPKGETGETGGLNS